MLLWPPKVSCTHFLLQETCQQGEPGGLLPAQSGGRDWGEVVVVRGSDPNYRLLRASLPEIGATGCCDRGCQSVGRRMWLEGVDLGRGPGRGCVLFYFYYSTLLCSFLILGASPFSYIGFSFDAEATPSARLLYLVRVPARI